MARTYLGETSWLQDAPERWSTSPEGIDTLTVPFSGPETGRVAFQNTLTRWESSSIDGNMFLANWSGNQDKQYPRIDLTYIGRKGGELPVDIIIDDAFVIQQARYNTLSGKTTVNVEYLARVTTTVKWDTSPFVDTDLASVESGTGDIVGIWYTAVTTEGGSIPGDLISALGFFAQRVVTSGISQEVVPSQYYLARITAANLLFSSAY